MPTVAANRGVESPKLNRLVRGELDWVVMKALEKDRNRRYETATGLADDIQRYLKNEAVQACPPSAAYRFRKFTHRHKFGVVAGATVAVAILLGLAGSTAGMIYAMRERKAAQISAAQAKTQAAKSDQVAKFLEDMLKGVSPSVAMGRDTTLLRDIADRTAERVNTDLKDQPEVQIEVLHTLAQVYLDLTLNQKGRANRAGSAAAGPFAHGRRKRCCRRLDESAQPGTVLRAASTRRKSHAPVDCHGTKTARPR